MNIRSEKGTMEIKTLKKLLIAIIFILNLIFWGLIFFAYAKKANIQDTTNSTQFVLNTMTENVKFVEFEGTGKSAKEIRTLKNTVNVYNKANIDTIVLNCPSTIKEGTKYTVKIKYSWFGRVEKITVKAEY